MPRRILNGTVCSASNTKTVVVKVERMLKHPIYKKYIKKYIFDKKHIFWYFVYKPILDSFKVGFDPLEL